MSQPEPTGNGNQVLSMFVYTNPEILQAILEELEDAAKAKVERVLASQQEWHPFEEALRAIDSLLELLTEPASPADQSLVPLRLGGTLEPLIWDLRALRHVLQESRARFHLEVL